MRFGLGFLFASGFGILDRSASCHQVAHKCHLPFRIEFRIGQSP
jgi:hypothetical protein